MEILSTLALILLFFILFLSLFASWWFISMLIPIILKGGPYVPSSWKRVEDMIKMARITPTDTVIDLGSGDGRLLIASLQAGAKKAEGYEIHRGLVSLSRWIARKKRVQDRLTVYYRSFWKADLKNCDIIFLYQLPLAMKLLVEKIKKEAKPGTRIVSNSFSFPDWNPLQNEGGIYLYQVPQTVSPSEETQKATEKQN